DETSKDKEIDKLMALISLSFKKIYKPTNNNLRTSSNTSRANQDNSPRINENAGYESQRSGNVAVARETVEFVHKTYLIEQDAHNVIIESVDMNYDSEQIDQNDEDADLAKEPGSKDRPLMLAPGNYVQWKSRIKRYIDTKPNHELIHYCLENPPYQLDWTNIKVPVSEGSPITITERIRIDNDIYSTVDACPNACEMWKAIERLKQGESINVQDLETNMYWEFVKFTSHDGESLESYYSRLYKMMNELIRNQCKVTIHQVNVQFLLQLQPEWQRFMTLVKQSQELKTISYHKLYDILKQHQHEVNEIRAEKIAQPSMVAEDDEMSKDKEIDKLMALISLSFKKIYKPTTNNLRTSSNISRANQDNSPRINRSAGYENQSNGNVAGARETVGSSVVQKYGIQCYNCKEFRHVARECQKPKRAKDAAYHREKMLLCKQEEAEIQLNAEQADWRDDTDDDELEDQELEAHYIYMAQLQEVSPDAADSGPIFDDEPLQKVSNDDHYNVFAVENVHPEQSKSVHDTYPIEQDVQNVIIDSLDMSYDREEIDQNDDDNDLAKEREIENFKTKNKSLESSNNFFKEANNRLSETNNLMYADYKKSEAELARRNSTKYASQMELECAKVRELKDKLSAHQETISILSKQKEAQIKLYKTREEKELDKVIELEDKMNTILGMYTKLDEVTNLQCDYLELLEKCEGLEAELSKSKMMSTSFESVQKHAINFELELQ
nr:hypothetical protein [Tanacetum cinerariifolium]